MVKVEFHGKLLEKTQLPFEDHSVLNPCCIVKDDIVHMFYRAVTHGNISSIGHCQIYKDKVIDRAKQPILVPEYDYEIHGIEDPRISEVEGLYYLFYTAYDGKNARTALATSTDLIKFEKQGLVSPSITYREGNELFLNPALPEKYNWYAKHYQKAIGPDVMLWEKDFILFPEKFNGKFLIFHRVMPGIQYMYLDSLEELKSEVFWKKHLTNLHEQIVIDPKFWFETRKIGSGCPPIKTPEGWVEIYHAVETTAQGNVYRPAAVLLDLKNPERVIGRLPEPLFSPYQAWEKSGVVNNVIFPTGAIVYEDSLYIYYGAADACIATASVNLAELVLELKNNKV